MTWHSAKYYLKKTSLSSVAEETLDKVFYIKIKNLFCRVKDLEHSTKLSNLSLTVHFFSFHIAFTNSRAWRRPLLAHAAAAGSHQPRRHRSRPLPLLHHRRRSPTPPCATTLSPSSPSALARATTLGPSSPLAPARASSPVARHHPRPLVTAGPGPHPFSIIADPWFLSVPASTPCPRHLWPTPPMRDLRPLLCSDHAKVKLPPFFICGTHKNCT